MHFNGVGVRRRGRPKRRGAPVLGALAALSDSLESLLVLLLHLLSLDGSLKIVLTTHAVLDKILLLLLTLHHVL